MHTQPCAGRLFRTTEDSIVKRRFTGLVRRGLRHSPSERDHPIEKIVLRSAGLARQPSDAQIDDAAVVVANALKPLLGAAMAGNVHAIRKVTELASDLCAETTTLACMHQEAANTVARERTTWPLNISHDAKDRRRALRLVNGPRRLPLGNPVSRAVVASRTRRYSSPATAVVLVALKAIEIERSFRIPSELFPTLQPRWSAAAARLPDLQPSTAGAWFEVIWMYVCDRHAGVPEQSALQRLILATEPPPHSTGRPNARTLLRETLEATFLRLVQGRVHHRRR